MKTFCLISLAMLSIISCSNTKKVNEEPDGTLHYLALGDSYTIGESVATTDNFPNLLVKHEEGKNLKFDQPEIIARTGWRTDQLIKAIEQTTLKHSTYDLVSLLIGVNDEFQGRTIEQYEPQFRTVLQKAIQLANNDPKKVWVFSIPDYGFTPYGSTRQTSISKRIDEFNTANKKIAKDLNVHYLEITEISRKGLKDTKLVADDGLHPSKEMYQLWVDKFFKEFK